MPDAPRETPPTCGTCRFAKWKKGDIIGDCFGPIPLPLLASFPRRDHSRGTIWRTDTDHCPVHQPHEEPADAIS